jgi:hypothetical protein
MSQVLQANPDSGQTPRQAEPLQFFWACDIQAVLDGQFVVKRIVQVGTLIVVFGESNSGKTFFVLDLVLAIAGGQFWRGRKVTRGLVVGCLQD